MDELPSNSAEHVQWLLPREKEVPMRRCISEIVEELRGTKIQTKRHIDKKSHRVRVIQKHKETEKGRQRTTEIETERDRETDRQTDRHTDRDRETERQRQTETDRQTQRQKQTGR